MLGEGVGPRRLRPRAATAKPQHGSRRESSSAVPSAPCAPAPGPSSTRRRWLGEAVRETGLDDSLRRAPASSRFRVLRGIRLERGGQAHDHPVARSHGASCCGCTGNRAAASRETAASTTRSLDRRSAQAPGRDGCTTSHGIDGPARQCRARDPGRSLRPSHASCLIPSRASRRTSRLRGTTPARRRRSAKRQFHERRSRDPFSSKPGRIRLRTSR